MNLTQTILLLLLVVTIRTSLGVEDLLDQYVKHVDSVNKVELNNDRQLFIKIKKRNQRFRRDVSTSSSEDRSDSSSPISTSLSVEKFKVQRRRRRSVNFAMRPMAHNDFEDRSRRMKQQKKANENQRLIQTDFSPDVKPYLDNLSPSGASNDLDETQESFRRKRHNSRKKRDALRKKRDVSSSDLNQWTHSEVLDSKGDIVLRWQPRHQEISFRVEARTRGYVGIGFSPNGGMEGADMVIGWVDDGSGKSYLFDYHGSKNQGSEPVKDETDNYTLMKGEQNDTHTILEFRRALDTCDPDDYVLSTDTVRVIWATHDKDPPENQRLVYHMENRGTQSLHLLGPPPIAKINSNAQMRNWDVTLNNFEVKNNMDTIYWCKIFKAPTLQQKHHIIGYVPLVGKNHTNFVHHMLLHECQLDQKADLRKWEEYSKENGRPCYEDMAIEWEKCLTPVVAWAVGSKGEDFPNHVGIPLAEKTTTFYKLEVHFDNPSMKKSVDTTGLRLHYTTQLRPNDGGILVTGITLSPLHIIPPLQKAYKSAGYCSTSCTEHMFPKDGINVVSVLLHSHLAGRKLKLRHIRGRQELSPLAQDNHYDFNYQQSRRLSQEIKILPGDALVTECTYNTGKRKKPTFGGYSTQQEMCLAFVLHYPRTELAGCYSMPPVNYFFNNLGVQKFYDKSMFDVENIILHGSSESPASPSTPLPPLFSNKPGDELSPEANQRAILALKNAKEYTIETDGNSASNNILDHLIIQEPPEFQNKSFMSHLDALPYEEQVFTQKIEEYFYRGLHLTFCRKRDDTLALGENVENLPEFTPYSSNDTKVQCSYRLRHTNEPSSARKMFPSTSLAILFVIRHFL